MSEATMPYTAYDSPTVVARIERDLADIVQTVRAGDPGLKAMILTGGFARGEGAMLDGAPQNDYDLVAIRGLRPARISYGTMREQLETRLAMHVDLAPVPAWRLPFASHSIFWYETALRGRVLWGPNGSALLARIPMRTAAALDPAEGLRLLANRAAGLLLSTAGLYDVRLQASKALMAALDTNLLAIDSFAPSQTERWRRYAALTAAGQAPASLAAHRDWLEWAYRYKIDPAGTPKCEAQDAWRAARAAVLDAVPIGLRHAGLRDLDAYARRDGLWDRLLYLRKSAAVPGARRLASHPAAQLRVATLRLLAAAEEGRVRPGEARGILAPLAKAGDAPLLTLDALRRATPQ